jgi:hypothetical protein
MLIIIYQSYNGEIVLIIIMDVLYQRLGTFYVNFFIRVFTRGIVKRQYKKRVSELFTKEKPSNIFLGNRGLTRSNLSAAGEIEMNEINKVSLKGS